MPAKLTPIKAVKCTYPDCTASFDTVSKMQRHKKESEHHDYCGACDKDFESYEDLALHKAFTPEKHNRACRECGEEFKSESGLKRHVELSHKVGQSLACIGCGDTFPTPAMYIEHLEFNHCNVITAQQFTGHVVHKKLIGELLSGGKEHDRFQQKISQYDAALDQDEDGGVSVDNPMDNDDNEAARVQYLVLQPEDSNEATSPPVTPWPSLSQSSSAVSTSAITSGLDGISLAGSETATVVGAPTDASFTPTPSSRHEPKAWGGRSARKLFPQAASQPAPASEFSIESVDQQTVQHHGINIMTTRFWDPLTRDWSPEHFFNTLIQEYYCPFPCEQSFQHIPDLRDHILASHRVNRAKCPYCLKYFDCITSLMGHCQARGSKCQVNKAADFNIFLDKLTGGFICVEDKVRPSYIADKSVEIKDARTGQMVKYEPDEAPQAITYLAYSTGTPMDWIEPRRVAGQIGGGAASGTFNHQNRQCYW